MVSFYNCPYFSFRVLTPFLSLLPVYFYSCSLCQSCAPFRFILLFFSLFPSLYSSMNLFSPLFSPPYSPSHVQACGSGSPCPSETAEPSPDQASPEAGSQIAAGQGRYQFLSCLPYHSSFTSLPYLFFLLTVVPPTYINVAELSFFSSFPPSASFLWCLCSHFHLSFRLVTHAQKTCDSVCVVCCVCKDLLVLYFFCW